MNPQDLNQPPNDPYGGGAPEDATPPQQPYTPPVAPQPPAQPQPQQPVQPQSAQGPVPQQAYGDPYANSPQPGNNRLGVLSLILAVICAPVGFVLGIISIIKGFGSGNKKLGLMGLAAIPLSIIAGLTFLIFLGGFLGGGLNKLSNLQVKTITATQANAQVSIKIPEQLKETAQRQIFGTTIDATFNNSVSQTDGGTATVVVFWEYLQKEQVSQVIDILNNPSDPMYESTKLGAKMATEQLLSEAVCKGSIANIADVQIVDVKGADMGLRYDFSCKTGDNKNETEGIYLAAMNKDEGAAADVILAGVGKAWYGNRSVWDEIYDSIELARN